MPCGESTIEESLHGPLKQKMDLRANRSQGFILHVGSEKLAKVDIEDEGALAVTEVKRTFASSNMTSENHIKWERPLMQENRFFTLDYAETIAQYSQQKYLQCYGKDSSKKLDLSLHMEEFDDWYLDAPFKEGDVRILCCPEDRKCNEKCLSQKRLCKHCSVPVCRTCGASLFRKQQSPVALSNDLMVFYAPQALYTDGGLTVMEMICASTCITSMICFSLEVKFGNMFNTKAMMQRHRVGARGNATSFQLPWEALLQQLR